MSNEIVVLIGTGGIGQAIARRQGSGRTVLLADRNPDALTAAAQALEAAGHTVSTHPVDVADRDSVHALAQAAARLGDVVNVNRPVPEGLRLGLQAGARGRRHRGQ
jgi:NADP-dependent 3-hydroxy acid dehydrogenase YdfG